MNAIVYLIKNFLNKIKKEFNLQSLQQKELKLKFQN